MKKRILMVLLVMAMFWSFLTLQTVAMQLFIQVNVSTGGKHVTIEVEPTDRIEDVKAKIFDLEGIPVEDQILTFSGTVLEEGNTLQDYSIGKDSTIHLERINRYTVTFKADGQVVATVTVKHGETVTMPDPPAKEGYTVRWSHNGENISADCEIVAVYTPISAPPATGDAFTPALWVAVMLASAVALVVLLEQKKYTNP